MTKSAAIPTLSVAVSTADCASTVIANMQGLARQVAAIGGELIIVSGAPDNGGDPPHGIRFHRIPGASVFDCRAAALAIASADIVALTEDHCIPHDDWCARILDNFARRRDLVLLGGAVANASTRRLEDRMNYWMSFAAYAPGQVTARHPCVAQFIVKMSALGPPPKPGDLEDSIIEKFKRILGAVYVDPQLHVLHVQSHGFWKTFAVHFHNGRATGGYSVRRTGGRNLPLLASLLWAGSDARAHLRRTARAFKAGNKSALAIAGYLLLILPLVLAHGTGEFIGYHRGPGASPARLV
jgi:hypothetical protein